MIQFTIPAKWLREENAQYLANRIAGIVCGINSGFTPCFDSMKKAWRLNSGGEWAFYVKDNQGYVRYMYPSEEFATERQWEAMKTVIEWALKE